MFFLSLTIGASPRFTLFPYTTLFRSRFVGEFFNCSSAVSCKSRSMVVTKSCPGCGATTARSRRSPDRIDRKKHTSELQSRQYLVCRLLLEKKKKKDVSEELIHNVHT